MYAVNDVVVESRVRRSLLDRGTQGADTLAMRAHMTAVKVCLLALKHLVIGSSNWRAKLTIKLNHDRYSDLEPNVLTTQHHHNSTRRTSDGVLQLKRAQIDASAHAEHGAFHALSASELLSFSCICEWHFFIDPRLANIVKKQRHRSLCPRSC